MLAFCIAWLDAATGAAEIEPFGTDPGHRSLGLGTALCAEAVHRLSEAGGREVVIHPRGDDAYPVPRHVYGAIGFETVNRTRVFGRRREPAD